MTQPALKQSLGYGTTESGAPNAHGLWTSDMDRPRIVDSAGNVIDVRRKGAYVLHEFIDWHGVLTRVYCESSESAEEQLAAVERAKTIHGPHSREACCLKQQERLAKGEALIFASSYRPANYDPFQNLAKQFQAAVQVHPLKGAA